MPAAVRRPPIRRAPKKSRNWTVWFVKPRAPLTPADQTQTIQFPRRAGWSRGNRRGVWRGARGWGRPCRPAERSFSCRASSLRGTPGLITPRALVQNGTHFADGLIFDDEPDVCLGALPPWLDEFGSNDALFAAAELPPTAAEGSDAPTPLPYGGALSSSEGR